MKTVREMLVSLTTMLINPFWAPIIGICVENWRTKPLQKVENQMSRHDKRYRSEDISPLVDQPQDWAKLHQKWAALLPHY